MKIRLGFVSNSSSSSFIVSGKKKKMKSKIVIEVDLEKYASDTADCKEDVDKYFIDRYGSRTIKEMLEDYESLKDSYDKCIEEVNKGNTVFFGDFSNQSGDPMEEFLCDNGLKGIIQDSSITIIESEGGF